MSPGSDLEHIPADQLATSRMLAPHLFGNPLNVQIMRGTLEAFFLPITLFNLNETYVVESKDQSRPARPGLYAALQRTIVYRGRDGWEIEPDDLTAEKALIRIRRRTDPRLGKLVGFTMADAERAHLPERNPTYKTYPDRMLFARACTKAIALFCPHKLFDPAPTADRDEWEIIEAASRDGVPAEVYDDQPEAYTDPSGEKYDPDDVTRPFTE